MKIEKQVELTGVLAKVRVVAQLADGAQLVVWVSKRVDKVRFYGHASVKRFEAGADVRVDKPGLEWWSCFSDYTSALTFEVIERALCEAGRLSGGAAACLSAYARSGLADARTFGALSEFNA